MVGMNYIEQAYAMLPETVKCEKCSKAAVITPERTSRTMLYAN